jgi:hypothetical protein
MSKRRTAAVALLAWLAGSIAAADVESDLRSELVGSFALTRQAATSDCADLYTNNEVAGGRISGRGSERFAAGELVRIDNVKIGTFSGFEVLLSLVEPYRLTWQDGPFEVHDQRHCRLELRFDVPREVRKDRVRARAAIEAVLGLHDHEGAAKGDPAWNGRRVQPYPANWERTKREWEAWRRAQQNERVREKTESLLEQADRVLSYMPSDERYLASFGAGARYRGSESWSDCEAMLTASFYVTGSGADSRGWADGQLVAWTAQLARALQECYVDD